MAAAVKGGVRLEPEGREERPHASSLTLWPIGFAVGVVCVLVGLVVSWPAVAVGVVIGAVIGGIVTLPVLGFMVLPAFVDQESDDVDVGGVNDFPEGQFLVTTYLSAPEQGEVSRRTAYIRNNGTLEGQPSFTILSNRCVHLGCPVQPNGLLEEDSAQEERTETAGLVRRIPVDPSGFGCPCHGGQYDTEGNRTAGPPVRALDRHEYNVVNGRLILAKAYSVSEVEGEGASAAVRKYDLAGPGQHVDGVSSWLYPIQPPR